MLNGVAGLEFDSNQSMSLAPTWLHTFSPTFFNEFIIAGKRNVWFGGEVEGSNWPDKFGLPNPFNTGRWPQITGIGMGNYGYVTNDTKLNHENAFVLDDNLTKVIGKHEMQFGFHGRRDYLNILAQQRYPSPQLNFGTGATALYDAANSTPASPATTPLTGINMANMYLGYSNYQAQLAHNWFYLTDMEMALYFQDNAGGPTTRRTAPISASPPKTMPSCSAAVWIRCINTITPFPVWSSNSRVWESSLKLISRRACPGTSITPGRRTSGRGLALHTKL
jgi:hypothetical protein